MEQRPSAECDECFWWYEDAFLCPECRNNPKADERQPSEEKDPLTRDDKIGVFVTLVILFMTFATALLNLLAG